MQLGVGSLLIALLVLGLVFGLLERVRPGAWRRPLLRRGIGTDLTYWFFGPLLARRLVGLALLLVLAPLALAAYGRIDRDVIMHGFGPVSRWPLVPQAVAILVLVDLLGYWMHRAFHAVPWLWKFHAVHHSSTELDWLSAVRVHPGNDLGMKLATALPVLALGFPPLAVAGIMPLLTLLAIAVHARVDWDFGPLRMLIVSPRFHRWHHSDERGARGCNFAGLLPLWDRLFGTCHLPRGVIPVSFGAGDTAVPEGVLRQLAFPFRRA